MAWSLSGWLDVIELAPPLCRRQPRHPYRHERMTRDEEVPRASPERLHPAAGVYAPNVASMARKNLSHLTCFNCDQKGHYAIKCLEQRTATQKTSDSLGNLRVDETNVDSAPEATLKRIPCI